jgi:hypothetical protein
MKRPRVSIAGLMVVVAAIAVNIAVIRWAFGDPSNSEPAYTYACGVLPMTNIMLVVAFLSAPRLIRGDRMTPFLLGFEVAGAFAVFAFISLCSVALYTVIDVASAIPRSFMPSVVASVQQAPEWVGYGAEITYLTALVTLPQLTLALIGGWIVHWLRLTVRSERLGADTVVPTAQKANIGVDASALVVNH